MAAGNISTLLLVSALACICAPVIAHHSDADFVRDEHYSLDGIITAVQWSNPHILLTVSNDEHDMRVEWVTTAGAERTGVTRERLVPGNRIIVTGSRHRNPEVRTMGLIKELAMPAQDWRWISPSLKRTR